VGQYDLSQPHTLRRFRVNLSRYSSLTLAAAVCLCTSYFAHGQESLHRAGAEFVAASQPDAIPAALHGRAWSSSSDALVPESAATDAQTVNDSSHHQPESELIVEGLASYGHYKIFASGSDCKLYTAGVEYDRHSWGRFLKARMDYVAEYLPVVLLRAPITQDIWGTPTSPDHHIVYGMGISPIGFRMLWRDGRRIKPYLEAKGGMLGFTQKVLSQRATYEDFSLQSATGLNVNVNDKWGLRLGLFSDFHFSDDFIVPVNPGIDVMNANLGLVYHFGTTRP
jgi:Lipid A 3-O-deacylase (PagL)